jgi:hypothetical protein
VVKTGTDLSIVTQLGKDGNWSISPMERAVFPGGGNRRDNDTPDKAVKRQFDVAACFVAFGWQQDFKEVFHGKFPFFVGYGVIF